MALNILGTILPNTHVSKQDVVIDTVIAAPGVDQIGYHAGATVNLNRQLEIRNGWKYLWDQMRQRYILDPGKGFAGNIVIAAISINNMSEANLRISTDLIGTLNDDDIILSVGVNATGFGGRSLILESGYAVIRDAGGEFLKTV